MNIFRSSRSSRSKENFRTEIVAEGDDGSSYRYYYGDEFSEDENPSKQAVEMENILGNALALTERSNGSIHSLQRSGTNSAVEIGRRIASIHSRENMAISDAHLVNNDSFSYISRTSSFDSSASLPTFVKIAREGDPDIVRQHSWDNMMSNDYEEKDDEQNSSGNAGYYNTNNLESALRPKTSNRSWNKLRREVDQESGVINIEGEENLQQRVPSLGKRASDFRKKIIRDFRNKSNHDEQIKNHSINRNQGGMEQRKGIAKDYDVEVTLENRKKSFWDRHPAIVRGVSMKKALKSLNNYDREQTSKRRSAREQTSKRRSAREQTSKRRSAREQTSKRRSATENVKNSFDNTKTEPEDLSRTPVEETLVERKSNVVLKMHEVHKGDLMFEALEVACCHSINDDTLDLITDMVPPRV